MTINITPIHAFNDNYIWAITKTGSSQVILVDPGDFKASSKFIEEQKLSLAAILITHHHHDHVGAIEQLAKTYNSNVCVYGPATESIPGKTIALEEENFVEFPDFNLTLRVLDVPGHTSGHIVYYNNDILFCGDTLFSGGCGRLFEGTAEQMHHSLSKLSQLPQHTKVFCAHEYTLANLHFALAVEPDNQELLSYFNQVKTYRDHNKPTLPSTIAQEKLINPFLRCNQPSIQDAATLYCNHTLNSEAEVFAIIRRWKDEF